MIGHKKSYALAFTAFVFFAVGCGGGDGGNEPPEPIGTPPAKATGILPANGEPCSDYTVVQNSDTQVEVAFSWAAARGALSYLLIVRQGASEVARESLSTIRTNVILDRGTTYTWSVDAVNDDGTTAGDTYSFTTPGTPEGNFAPYAAVITIDFDTSANELTVSWTCSDEDGDPLTYDIEILEDGQTLFEEVELTDLSIAPLPYLPAAEYRIEITARDTNGNFSIAVLEEKAPR